MTRDADVEPSREAITERERREDDRRTRLDEVVTRRSRRALDAQRERPVADRRRAVDSETERQTIERSEVRRQREERRDERSARVLDRGERTTAPRGRRIVRVVRITTGAPELERVQEEVAAEKEARASLPREAGRVPVNRGRIVGAGGERRTAPHRLRAVIGDLEPARVRHARRHDERERDGEERAVCETHQDNLHHGGQPGAPVG